MFLTKSIFILSFIISLNSYSQSLMSEPIRKIPARKKSIFLKDGIFHNGGVKINSQIKAIRHSYSEKQGYERVVFDFKTAKVPKIYGQIAHEKKKIYLDLYNTQLPEVINSFGNSKFVESINFFPVDKESLSVELNFKTKTSVDLFYLEKPGRFVIDVRGSL